MKVPDGPEGARASWPPEGSDADPAILPGTRYRVIGKLAKGGMGEVVEAEHVRLMKRVAIKILHGRFEGRPAILDRMRVEAQALAHLSHPNIVQVSDFGTTDDGRTYLVMERLYGKTLRQELSERGALPPGEAIAVTQQILAGLGAAHDAGIIHRDVKLDNIFLCDAPEGPRRVKLLDFGIAKIVRESEGADAQTPAPLAYPTAAGFAVGTPRYFSPEQARGRPVDARADIYAAGHVLYILLAGRGPFDHLHAQQAILDAHAETIPEPPSRFTKEALPPELERAVLKALAKSPDDRFETARTFAVELAAIASRLGAAAVASVKKRWASTEPIEGSAPARTSSSGPAGAALQGKGTERIPAQAAMVEAQRRSYPSSPGSVPPAAPQGEAIPADLKDPTLATTLPLSSAAEKRPSFAPPVGALALEAPRSHRRSTRLVFAISLVTSAIVFGALTAVLLLHLVR